MPGQINLDVHGPRKFGWHRQQPVRRFMLEGHTPDQALRPDESAFIARLKAGDGAAFEELVRSQTPRLLAVARSFLRRDDDAFDAVQDAFASAFQHLDDFAEQAQISTWLQRILINVCLMKLRRQSRHPTVSIDELLPTFDDTGHHVHRVQSWSETPPARLTRGELQSHVRDAIDRLPEPYRAVLLLRDIQELGTDETALMLGITPANVKTRLHRARQALRNLIDPIWTGQSDSG
jgi:RNA polymerase sigma-70 factor (ECF subfamily)